MIGHILWNRLRILSTDRLFLLAMIVMPLLLSLISGAAMQRETAAGISIALVASGSDATELQFTQRMLKLEGINVRQMGADEAERLLEARQIEAILAIPKDIEQRIEAGVRTSLVRLTVSPYALSGSYLRERIAAELTRLVTPAFISQWLSERPHIAVTEEVLSESWAEEMRNGGILTIDYEELAQDASVVPSTIRIHPAESGANGLLVLFVMFSILYGSSWLVEEKQNGTLARMTASGVSAGSLLLGNAGALYVGGIFTILLYRLAAYGMFGLPFVKSPAEAVLLLTYLLAAVGLGMLLAAMFPKGSDMQSAAPLLALLTGFAGGCLWSRFPPGGTVQLLSLSVPQGWAILGMNQLSSGTHAFAWLPVVVLCAMGLMSMVLSLFFITKSSR